MDVKEAILKRKSIRAFLDKPVDPNIIKEILDVAKRAPSASNLQPWDVYVITGAKQKELAESYITKLVKEEQPMDADFEGIGYPLKWVNPFLRRRRINGLQLYKALGVQKSNDDAKKLNWSNNYRSFGSPVTILFGLHKSLNPGSFFDYGTFMQNINLLALEYGLGTCLQGAWGEYPKEARKVLGISEDIKIVCGMTIGYIDETNPVNQYETPREDLDEFVTFIE